MNPAMARLEKKEQRSSERAEASERGLGGELCSLLYDCVASKTQHQDNIKNALDIAPRTPHQKTVFEIAFKTPHQELSGDA
jgi:hypothetical protein